MPPSTDAIQAFEVRRDRLTDSRVVSEPLNAPAPGQVLIRVDAFALTANNVTYGVAGDTIGYWQFFPARSDEDGWGRIPVWGFGDVVRSRVDGITEGERFYGYFPMASHLVAKPERVSERGFTDAAAHRAALPSVYNQYTATAADPAYRADQEEHADAVPAAVHHQLLSRRLPARQRLLRREHGGALQCVQQDVVRAGLAAAPQPPRPMPGESVSLRLDTSASSSRWAATTRW